MPKLDSFKRTLNRMKHEGLVDGKRGNPGGGFRLHPAHRVELVAKRRF
jgi:DNA-binding IscR family transcriptional regulator